MSKNGNSLAADVGYWQNTHLLRSPETQPTLKLCKSSPEKQEQRGHQEMLDQVLWCCPSHLCQMMLA